MTEEGGAGTDAPSVGAGAAATSQHSFMRATVPTRVTASALADHLKLQYRHHQKKIGVTNGNGAEEVKPWVVVDVRDGDFVGGNIINCVKREVSLFEDDDDVEEFVKDILATEPTPPERIVFHCMLSQQRGPFAARRFLSRLGALVAEEDEEGQQEETAKGLVIPEVSILNGGFNRFQSLFKNDKDLVENYDARYHR